MASIALMALLHFTFPVVKLLDFPWNLGGMVLLLAGALLNLSADQAFKTYQTTVKPFEESSVLITSGVFGLSRNPMYLGMVLILLGIALLLGTLTPVLIIPVFTLAMNVVFITAEEHMLAEKFGEDWEKYKNKVRRWL